MSENSHSVKCRVGLLVIRSNDMDRAADFYSALGMKFTKHSHPPCGEHYSSVEDDCVFEICQRRQKQSETTATVFGFNVSSLDRVLSILVSKGSIITRPPEESEWGRSAVIRDLDGHSVFLCEKP